MAEVALMAAEADSMEVEAEVAFTGAAGLPAGGTMVTAVALEEELRRA